MTGAEGAATSSSGTPALLATHKPLLDAGRLQDDEPYLAGTARRPTAVLAADLAAAVGAGAGDLVEVSTASGTVVLPALPMADGSMAPGTVWLPECSAGSTVRQSLGAHHGSTVTVSIPTEVARS